MLAVITDLKLKKWKNRKFIKIEQRNRIKISNKILLL